MSVGNSGSSSSGGAKNLGELLVRSNLIEIDQLEKAKREQKTTGGRLGTTLVKLGYLNQQQLAEFLSKQYQVPSIDLASFEIDADALKSVPKNICEKHQLIPVSKAGNTIVVAMSDPTNLSAREDVHHVTRCRVEVVVAGEIDIAAAIEKSFGVGANYTDILNKMEQEVPTGEEENKNKAEMIDLGDEKDAPIIKFVNLMLAEAVNLRASDIHIEPYEKRFRIRYRIDGVLYEKVQPPPGIANRLVSRVKIMSKLDIAERRRPQDGRLKINLKGKKETDFRVSCVPTVGGEKIVLRILDKSNLQLDMTSLGFEADELATFDEVLKNPYGMILITGPTGSGKTTTIYSALAKLNTADVNISTAEDPVEFNLDGINQVQMNADVDLNFASALRAFLRQDPDVIMVGEIRDFETADIAFKAAMTGHLVVSTLHTNDAPQTVSRLLNMGFEPFVVTSAVNLIVAQRLVRRVCKSCAVPIAADPQVLMELGVPEAELDGFNMMKGQGCEVCNGIGFKGRVAVYELLKFSEPLKQAVFSNASPSEIKKAAIAGGMRTLRMNALRKLKLGLTSIEEIVDNTAKDEV